MRFVRSSPLLTPLILSAVCVFQFLYQLGSGEVQPWDEALYLIRSNAILRYGCWLDQTRYAVHELYSSTHPPLIIWLMTVCRWLLGETEFAGRLVTAVFSVIAVLCVYKLLCLLVSKTTALFTSVMLATVQIFVLYEHSAQLDVHLLALLAATSYFSVRMMEKQSRWIVVAALVCFAAALLSKAFQGLYLVPFLLALPWVFRRKGYLARILIVIVGGIALAAPWYIMMTIRHPTYLSEYVSLLAAIKTGTYSYEGLTEWWYYLNQITISFPVLLLAPLLIVPIVKARRSRQPEIRRCMLVSGVWFVGMLVGMSTFESRMDHYALFLALPATLVSAFLVEELRCMPLSRFVALGLVAVLFLGIFWSADELPRIAARGHRTEIIPEYHLIRWSPVTLCVLLVTLLPFGLGAWTSLRDKVCYAACVALITLSFYRLEAQDDHALTDGAQEVANVLASQPRLHTIVALTEDFPHEDYLPQFNYYANGWMLGWDESHSGRTMTWQKAEASFASNSFPKADAAIVYVSWSELRRRSDDEVSLLARLGSQLTRLYLHHVQTKKYDLYY